MASTYLLPDNTQVATKDTTGVVQIGNGINVDINGVISTNLTTLGAAATLNPVLTGTAKLTTSMVKGGTNPLADVFTIESSDHQALFQVKDNGDTIIAGVLTVNGTGTSSFAGDVSIAGKLTVAEAASVTAAMSGTDLTLSGNLVVKGNTTLGNLFSEDGDYDTTTINGQTTIYTHKTKSVIDNAISTWKASHPTATTAEIQAYKDSLPDYIDTFKIIDSTGAKLFQVKPNGDTVIAGVISVNGDGDSTFAGNLKVSGDVSIAGKLNVEQSASVSADMVGSNLTLTGNLIVKGNTTLGNLYSDDGDYDTTIIRGVTTIISKTTKDAGLASVDAFRIQDSAGASLFQVKENGDTVIAGVLTVNGTGTSSFAGDVSIAGHLNVAESSNVTASMEGTDLTLTGNLVVQGNTQLGDNASTDITTIKGVTTIISKTTKAAGSASVDVFKVVDSSASPVPLFEVRENGDTIIGGILKVNGTGTSEFAGDVSIAGKLSVAESASVTAAMSGTDLTLTGNLVVKGNTTLGDSTDGQNDTLTVNAATTFVGANATLTLAGDPTQALHAATKQYVDNTVQGLDVKQSVRVTTSVNITLSGLQTIDGVTLIANDRVLVKNQTTASQNGIYKAQSGAWVRAEDADISGKVTPGMYTWVEEGTVNKDSGWLLVVDGTINLGSTALNFVQFSGAGQITAGTGLGKNGNTLSLNKSTTTTLGGVIIGNGIDYDAATGTINVSPGGVGGVALSDVSTSPSPNTIVARDASGNITAVGGSFNGKILKVASIDTAGNFGVQTITSNANDVVLANTTQTTVVTFSPTIKGNYLVYIYFRVITATTTLNITVNYNDGSGVQSQVIVNGSNIVNSYSVSPIFINADSTGPISVKATAGTANQVYVSANIVGL